MTESFDASHVFSQMAALPICLDEVQASLQGPTQRLHYEAVGERNPVGFADRNGFEGYSLQFADETKGLVELDALAERGGELASLVYTYRSVAKALPPTSGDEANKRKMYSASFEVLEPHINRIKALLFFKVDGIQKFCTNLHLLARNVVSSVKGKEKEIPCEALYMQLLYTLDVFVVLDSIKDAKACINNDFAFYKRAFQLCAKDVEKSKAEQITNEMKDLQPFWGLRQVLLNDLKREVQAVPGFDEVVATMASLAIDYLDNEWYVLPSEKHRLIRASAYALWLLDTHGSDREPKINAFKHKKIALKNFGRWLKRYPIVPLYGDMHANLQQLLGAMPNFATISASELFPANAREQAKNVAQYDVVQALPVFRKQAASYIAELSANDHCCKAPFIGSLPRDERTAFAQRLVDTVLKGFRLMLSVNSVMMEFISFKFSKPASDELIARRGGSASSATDYEKVLRYNLGSQEKTALVECLALLKGVHTAISTIAGESELLIRRAIHEATQYFIHTVMGPPTRKAVKYDKKLIRHQLMQLRNMCADWSDGVAIMDEDRIKSKQFKGSDHTKDYPARSVAPSATQLWLIRATVQALCDERAPHMKATLLQDPDLPKETVKDMKDFLHKSASYPYLLRLPATLSSLADVSYMWMREYHLELCMRVQFPVSMSLPAILIEHIQSQGNSVLMPLLFSPMETYNDASASALRVHRQQFLFTEIEAELNLIFDNVLFNLSDQIFKHFKTRAAVALLQQHSNADGENAYDPEVRQATGKNFFAPLLGLRRVHLLGRSVHFARLLTQRMNAKLHDSLDLAIRRFEARDLGHVLELQRMLRVCRLTHELLSEWLPDIDPFDQLMTYANASVTFLSFSSRILEHAKETIKLDLLPNYAYRANGHTFQRPMKMPFTTEPERDALPRLRQHHMLFGTKQLNAEFQFAHARQTQSGVGPIHVEALLEVLGEGGLNGLLADLRAHVGDLIEFDITGYVAAVQEALPPNSKLPGYEYGASGCYLYFDAKLKDLAGYEELHSGVVHNFRRLGNAVVLLQMLDAAVQAQATSTLLHLPSYGGDHSVVKAASMVAGAHGESPEDSDTVEMARQVTSLCSPLASNASILLRSLVDAATVMARVKGTWLAGDSPQSDLSAADTTKAFYKVWSAVQFLFCTVPLEMTNGQTLDNVVLFGDGVPLAGALCLHFLGQRHRFELFDFAQHVLAVFSSSEGTSQQADTTLREFIGRYMTLKAITERAHAMFDTSHMPTCFNVWRYT